MIVLLVPLLFLSGCLGTGDVDEPIMQEPVMVESEWDNQSHQFWNVNPVSVGNTSVITFNNTGDLNFTVNLTTWFHEPVLWEQGFLNYSLIYENETVWSIQVTNVMEDYRFNMTNVTGSITVQIQANGSDSPTDDKPGDYYMASAEFHLQY